jgi:hypothetical protein
MAAAAAPLLTTTDRGTLGKTRMGRLEWEDSNGKTEWEDSNGKTRMGRLEWEDSNGKRFRGGDGAGLGKSEGTAGDADDDVSSSGGNDDRIAGSTRLWPKRISADEHALYYAGKVTAFNDYFNGFESNDALVVYTA